MRKFRALILFQIRIVIPAIFVSLLSGGFGLAAIPSYKGFCMGCGLGYMFFAPLFHYFIYELRNPGEYYFYYNLGLSKMFLWGSTVISAILFRTILMML